MGGIYDSGEFATVMKKAIEAADAKGFRRRKRESRKRGKLRGLGIGSYLEVTAPPSKELGGIVFEADGSVTILSGTLDFGMGHASPFAQVLHDKLGVPLDKIRADADRQRQAPGRRRLRRLEVADAYRHGAGRSRRQGDRSGQARSPRISWKPLPPTSSSRTGASSSPAPTGRSASWSLPQKLRSGINLPEGVPTSLDVKHVSDGPGASAYPNGCHVCEVEVDPDTGVIEVVKYSAVNDFGTVINPMIVEGQLHGGVVQGIGQALMEMTAYDAEGQLLTGSYMDYAMPRAVDAPNVRGRRTIRCRPRPIRSASRAAARPAAPAR